MFKIASTTGGFFTGFGLCVLLICFGGTQIMEAYSGEIENAKYYANRLYTVTHSSTYLGTMKALNTISPYANEIGNALENPLISWMALGWLSYSLKQIRARAIYDSSERVYFAMQALEVVPEYLTYGMVVGCLLIFTGVILVIRARKLESRA